MNGKLSKAQHYRNQGDRLRELAAPDDNIETREALLSVARKCDQLSVKYSAMTRSKSAWCGRDGRGPLPRN
jgi:hypothetical protein